MTALPADVARALQGLRKCGCGAVFRPANPLDQSDKFCNDCAAHKHYGAAKPTRKQPALKPRGLGEY